MSKSFQQSLDNAPRQNFGNNYGFNPGMAQPYQQQNGGFNNNPRPPAKKLIFYEKEIVDCRRNRNETEDSLFEGENGYGVCIGVTGKAIGNKLVLRRIAPAWIRIPEDDVEAERRINFLQDFVNANMDDAEWRLLEGAIQFAQRRRPQPFLDYLGGRNLGHARTQRNLAQDFEVVEEDVEARQAAMDAFTAFSHARPRPAPAEAPPATPAQPARTAHEEAPPSGNPAPCRRPRVDVDLPAPHPDAMMPDGSEPVPDQPRA